MYKTISITLAGVVEFDVQHMFRRLTYNVPAQVKESAKNIRERVFGAPPASSTNLMFAIDINVNIVVPIIIIICMFITTYSLSLFALSLTSARGSSGRPRPLLSTYVYIIML